MIDLDPNNDAAYTGRGLVDYRLGNYQPSIVDYTKAIELNPQNETAVYNRGLAYADLGNFQQAITDYTTALELNPQDPDVYYFRAIAYKNQGDYERAIADYSQVIELDPDADTYDKRGQAYFAAGNDKQAIADLTQATQLDSNNASLWNTLCRIGSLVGVASETIAACEQAVKLAPDEGNLRDSRGLARALTGDYEGAIEDFGFYVDWSKQHGKYNKYGVKREAWIAELKASRNPFDEQTLEELEDE